LAEVRQYVDPEIVYSLNIFLTLFQQRYKFFLDLDGFDTAEVQIEPALLAFVHHAFIQERSVGADQRQAKAGLVTLLLLLLVRDLEGKGSSLIALLLPVEQLEVLVEAQDLLAGFVAVGDWHMQVEEDEIVLISGDNGHLLASRALQALDNRILDLLEGHLPVDRSFDLEVQVLKQQLLDVELHRVVVRDQH